MAMALSSKEGKDWEEEKGKNMGRRDWEEEKGKRSSLRKQTNTVETKKHGNHTPKKHKSTAPTPTIDLETQVGQKVA